MTAYKMGSMTGLRYLSPDDRFLMRVEVDEITGCHQWVGGKARWGYGALLVNGHKILAHRYAWQRVNGPIPKGMQIDHLCKNTSCVNPAHLEVVTGLENILRSDGMAAMNSRKTQCKNGHPFDEANTGVSEYRGRPRRYCRECNRLRSIEKRKRPLRKEDAHD